MQDNFEWTDELACEFCNYFRNLPLNEVIKENQFKKFKEEKSKQQSVENKDWEIVDSYRKCIDGFWTGEVLIRGVRRLSDNEVFTVGNMITWGYDKDFSDKLISFKVMENGALFFSTEQIQLIPFLEAYFLHNINQNKPLFTTEDNVPIYEGDEYAYVPKETLAWVNVSDGYSTPQPKESFLYFSSKAKANDYVLIKKPCLSVDDVMSKYEQIINRISKPFKEHLIDLANEKINHQKQ